ncbi:MAG: hypothetical protein KC488_13765 [Candidatus Cloacimonetes bacterium]|nr:hypothetical protein [Candidatus Cloacimonadota bacterium]
MARTEIHPSDEVRLLDPSKAITGTTLATTYELRRAIHCGVTGTYRVYGVDGTTSVDLPLASGMTYPYMTTKITNTSDAATTSGDVFAFL